MNAFTNCPVCARFFEEFYSTTHIFKPMLWFKYLYGSAFSFIYNYWTQYHRQNQEAGIFNFFCNYTGTEKNLLLVQDLVTRPNTHADTHTMHIFTPCRSDFCLHLPFCPDFTYAPCPSWFLHASGNSVQLNQTNCRSWRILSGECDSVKLHTPPSNW